MGKNLTPEKDTAGQLPVWYWVSIGVVILFSVLTCIFLPYKKYSLDFGQYGRVALRVQRFSGAQEIKLGDEWQVLDGFLIPSEDARRTIINVTNFSNGSSGAKGTAIVSNPTNWHLRNLIIGSTLHMDSGQKRDVRLLECNIQPFSSSEVPLALGQMRGTVEVLEASGKREQEMP